LLRAGKSARKSAEEGGGWRMEEGAGGLHELGSVVFAEEFCFAREDGR
jgi:hypothetical protein